MWHQINLVPMNLVPDLLLVVFTLLYIGKLMLAMTKVNSDFFFLSAFGGWKGSYEKRSLLNQRVNRMVKRAA